MLPPLAQLMNVFPRIVRSLGYETYMHSQWHSSEPLPL